MKAALLHIEAILFANEGGLALQDVLHVANHAFDEVISKNELIGYLEQIKEKYEAEEHIFSLHVFNGHYQFLTKEEYHPTLQHLEAYKDNRKLSQAALETLSIIAYRQPITKLEIEEIRGVNCDYSVQKLLEKNLIQIQGKAETVGKPILYGTSQQFMNHFGLKDVSELPQLKDLVTAENSIGEAEE
ncbi:SMC-Scp complex subunit ScpB [Sphingobacterium hungaricum]|uniref:SMC-Scp complex subunit ScpB n=1 Tax=Sphingobacterium hungaricum TaxID=2082723 RepID=A0A928UXG9_9SPHI|nr:SMC-Scp complex subunit ScpB [Sphingobacterium hungaricum]MBE8712577.1 SMC-Scp complex subunit ScpB [Sphingobacterium hungaricum]